jgi:alanyl-tRNA synthetase
MADENTELELTDDEAKQLLADGDGEKTTPAESETDSTDWKAEAERWKQLSRKNEKSFKDTQTRLKQFEDQGKSDLQRLIEERDALKNELGSVSSAAKRRDVAEELAPEHATTKQIRLVAKYLAGSSDDELQASAAELFAQLAPEPAKAKTPARPKENLKGGAEPDEPVEEADGRKIAAKIARSTIL